MSTTSNDSIIGVKRYRSRDGGSYFKFAFVQRDDHIAIYCLSHPDFNGREDSAPLTHLYPSGEICFVSGSEPQTMERAEQLAAQWAEYLVEYIDTGIPQS